MTNVQNTGQALRKTINEGFKEYDGDIREEALELLTQFERDYNDACTEMRRLNDDNTKLQDEYKELQERAKKLQAELLDVAPIEYEYKKINYGTTQIYFALPLDAPLVFKDLINALDGCAMSVPVIHIVEAIKKFNRF